MYEMFNVLYTVLVGIGHHRFVFTRATKNEHYKPAQSVLVDITLKYKGPNFFFVVEKKLLK